MLYVTIRESWAWLNYSGFWRSAKDCNEKPDKEDKRDDDCDVFAPLFVSEALLVAALTLSLGQLIPFFEIECHECSISLQGNNARNMGPGSGKTMGVRAPCALLNLAPSNGERGATGYCLLRCRSDQQPKFDVGKLSRQSLQQNGRHEPTLR
jgi:hypothetical protein